MRSDVHSPSSCTEAAAVLAFSRLTRQLGHPFLRQCGLFTTASTTIMPSSPLRASLARSLTKARITARGLECGYVLYRRALSVPNNS